MSVVDYAVKIFEVSKLNLDVIFPCRMVSLLVLLLSMVTTTYADIGKGAGLKFSLMFTMNFHSSFIYLT